MMQRNRSDWLPSSRIAFAFPPQIISSTDFMLFIFSDLNFQPEDESEDTIVSKVNQMTNIVQRMLNDGRF